MKTDLDKLNELIDWYEKNKPHAGKRIPVALSPANLAKMLGLKRNQNQTEWKYKGRTIYSTVVESQ